MGAGVIFAIVVVGALAYVVPWFVTRRSDLLPDPVDERSAQHFSESTKVVRRGADPYNMGDDDVELEVSTPHTRRAELTDIHRLLAAAAKRRRLMLYVLLLATVGVGVATPFTVLPWWSAAAGAGAIVAFLMVSRFSVVTMTRRLDRRRELITSGWDEDTVALVLGESEATSEIEVRISEEIGAPGSLWEPIPVTTPTYVSKPLAPRTVRTIDLSAPAVVASRVPVTAESQDEVEHTEDVLGAEDQRRASGE
jgi:hypothetical protein